MLALCLVLTETLVLFDFAPPSRLTSPLSPTVPFGLCSCLRQPRRLRRFCCGKNPLITVYWFFSAQDMSIW